jgi:hypothetical protein
MREAGTHRRQTSPVLGRGITVHRWSDGDGKAKKEEFPGTMRKHAGRELLSPDLRCFWSYSLKI